LTFNTQGKTDKWDLTERQADEWQKLYPALDVIACCRKAFAWAEANPAKRKTAKGMPAFLVNWLNREVNSSNGHGANAKASRDCDRCSGKGFIEKPDEHGGWSMVKHSCKRCQGTGKF
jgi:hypothetical protein